MERLVIVIQLVCSRHSDSGKRWKNRGIAQIIVWLLLFHSLFSALFLFSLCPFLLNVSQCLEQAMVDFYFVSWQYLFCFTTVAFSPWSLGFFWILHLWKSNLRTKCHLCKLDQCNWSHSSWVYNSDNSNTWSVNHSLGWLSWSGQQCDLCNSSNVSCRTRPASERFVVHAVNSILTDTKKGQFTWFNFFYNCCMWFILCMLLACWKNCILDCE